MPRGARTAELSIQALEKMLDQRRRDLDKLYKKRATIQRRLDLVDQHIAALGGSGPSRRGPAGSGRAHNDRSLAEVMRETLQKAGKPMKVSDIADAVKSAGYRSNSANFRGIVNQMLIKEKKQFTSPSRSFYQLKK